jgi:ribosomal protein S18 acetylase RimI-like enzyme
LTAWSIRTATAGDVPAVLELWRLAGSVPTPSDRSDSLLTLLTHDPGALLVAQAGGAVVGSLIAAWDGWRGSFYRLAVRPEHRRRGIATELVRIGEDRLRRRGAIRLTAIVAREERVAFELWEALGYTWQPEHLRFTRDLEAPLLS